LVITVRCSPVKSVRLSACRKRSCKGTKGNNVVQWNKAWKHRPKKFNKRRSAHAYYIIQTTLMTHLHLSMQRQPMDHRWINREKIVLFCRTESQPRSFPPGKKHQDQKWDEQSCKSHKLVHDVTDRNATENQ
jgi:hypothetical protein